MCHIIPVLHICTLYPPSYSAVLYAAVPYRLCPLSLCHTLSVPRGCAIQPPNVAVLHSCAIQSPILLSRVSLCLLAALYGPHPIQLLCCPVPHSSVVQPLSYPLHVPCPVVSVLRNCAMLSLSYKSEPYSPCYV